MIALDTNILVYAHRPECGFHAQAKAAIRGLAEQHPFAIPFHCLIEFSAIISNPKLWRQPSSPEQANDQIDAWLAAPQAHVLTEDAGMLAVFMTSWQSARSSGGAIHDLRIAAACRYHGISELWTSDRDFGRFPWLKVRNPLL